MQTSVQAARANGATCTDSLDDPTLNWQKYRCTCKAGYANGVCDYHYIAEFKQQCEVSEIGRAHV